MFSLLYADSTLVKVSKYAVHSLSRHGSRRKHALFPLNPAIRLGLKSRGREVLCVSSVRLSVHYRKMNSTSERGKKAPVGPAGERSWIICPCREPHTRNRDSSFHPVPILVQLPGPTGVLPRVSCVWALPRDFPRDSGQTPGRSTGCSPECWTTRDGQAAADRQPVRACSVNAENHEERAAGSPPSAGKRSARCRAARFQAFTLQGPRHTMGPCSELCST